MKIKLVKTELGTLLERTCDLLDLPRGTRLGVKVGHRQIRADRRYVRRPLPKRSAVNIEDDTTVQEAVSSLVRPRLPLPLRQKAKFIVYPPGARKPAKGNEHIKTARAWGDGLTRKAGEVFDAQVDEVHEKIGEVWEEVTEGAGGDEVFLRAVCRFYETRKQMTSIIDKHFNGNKK